MDSRVQAGKNCDPKYDLISDKIDQDNIEILHWES